MISNKMKNKNKLKMIKKNQQEFNNLTINN